MRPHTIHLPAVRAIWRIGPLKVGATGVVGAGLVQEYSFERVTMLYRILRLSIVCALCARCSVVKRADSAGRRPARDRSRVHGPPPRADPRLGHTSAARSGAWSRDGNDVARRDVGGRDRRRRRASFGCRDRTNAVAREGRPPQSAEHARRRERLLCRTVQRLDVVCSQPARRQLAVHPALQEALRRLRL